MGVSSFTTTCFTRGRSVVRSHLRPLNLAVREPWDAAGSAPDAPAVGCGRGDLPAGLKVRAVRSEFVHGVGKERLKRAEKVARPGDAVGVVHDVQTEGAVHLRPRTEAEKRSVGLEVGAEEVSSGLELIPETHRLADSVRDLGRDGGVWERWRAVDGGLRPCGESLVEPRIPCLVIANEGVEPLMCGLMRNVLARCGLVDERRVFQSACQSGEVGHRRARDCFESDCNPYRGGYVCRAVDDLEVAKREREVANRLRMPFAGADLLS